eukprot:14165-Heterococcus_DN1.PRE.2
MQAHASICAPGASASCDASLELMCYFAQDRWDSQVCSSLSEVEVPKLSNGSVNVAATRCALSLIHS